MGVLKELDLMETDDLLLVSIKSQEMYHQKEGKSVKTYVVSTSLNPPSCQENSFGTPWGLHEVNEIIGQDQPKGMVFQGRCPINLCYWECDEEMKRKIMSLFASDTRFMKLFAKSSISDLSLLSMAQSAKPVSSSFKHLCLVITHHMLYFISNLFTHTIQ